MREILFRGKSKINGEWVYGFYSGENCSEIFSPMFKQDNIIIKGSGFWVEVEAETVGEYTGLTDANCVRIFEGDIVRTYDPDDSPAVVNYDSSETMFAVVIDNIFFGLGEHFNGKDLTVIGNIHDNPELLGDKDT